MISAKTTPQKIMKKPTTSTNEADVLTPGAIIAAAPDREYVTLKKIMPAGALVFRKQSNGVLFIWRYTLNEKTYRVNIGLYSSTEPANTLEKGPTGFYSVRAATRAAEALAAEHVANLDKGGRPGLEQAKAEALAAAEKEKSEAAQYTLAALMYAYADYLEAQGKMSHREVRTITNNHIVEAHPVLAAAPANSLTDEDIATMQQRLISDDKGRTSNKLRAYVRAAYEVAKSSRSRPTIPILFKNFKITTNPAADTYAEPSFNRSDKKLALKPEAMIDYWQAIEGIQGFKGAVLRLHLLTGAQRIAQLVRLKTEDIEIIDGETVITLWDGKGRGNIVREHLIPLISPALAALKEIDPSGEFAISTAITETKRPRAEHEKREKKGDTHVGPTTLLKWSQDAVAAQNEIWQKEGITNSSGEIKQLKDFKAKQLRSGVETLLAREGVSDTDRGRLQSHGISGVQNTHYNAHEYINEKTQRIGEALPSSGK